MTAATASSAGSPFQRSLLPDWAQRSVVAVTVVLVVALIVATEISPALLIAIGALASLVGVGVWSAAVEGRRHAKDRIASMVVVYAFALAMAPLVSLLLTVTGRGLVRLDAEFLTGTMRNVLGAGGGASHAIAGTLVITGCATLMSVPIGIFTAIYLQEYGRGKGKLARAITFFVDVMTGIPSIVAGLFAFALFALFLGPGIRLGIMGAIALTVLMIPIVVRSTEEMLRIVPDGLRESAYALGTPKWRVITRIVLPTALAGIVTGVMLSIARVIGETAPLLITVGTVDSLNWNPFEGRMQNLAVFAYGEYKYPSLPRDASFDRAWAAALTLIIIVLVLTAIARLVQRRYGVLKSR